VPESFKESWKDEVGYMGILPDLYANRKFWVRWVPLLQDAMLPSDSLTQGTNVYRRRSPYGGLLDLRLLALGGQKFGRRS
jgi:hypothetical protein